MIIDKSNYLAEMKLNQLTLFLSFFVNAEVSFRSFRGHQVQNFTIRLPRKTVPRIETSYTAPQGLLLILAALRKFYHRLHKSHLLGDIGIILR